MNRIIALIMSLSVTLFPAFSSQNKEGYEKMTGLKDSVYSFFNKKEVTAAYHNGEPSGEVFDENTEFTLDETQTLIKTPGKNFTILNLTDMHYSDYGYRVFNEPFNTANIKRLAKKTNPDLITVTGDMVCGDSSYYAIQRITDLMESFGIPWAPVFGNHDDEANCNLDFLAETMMKSPHCLMKKGDSRMGVGNYIINIAEKDGDGLKICESIFMMDSHHSQPNELQQKWVKRAADGIKRISGGKAEVSLFMHIPLPEYETAYDEARDTESGEWRDSYNAFGAQHETVCCERDADGNPVQRGFFDIIKESGNVKYVFCGHDHMNDFSIEYQGIRLTYLMKLGLSSGFQPFFNGGSIITVGSEGINCITHKISIFGGLFNLENMKTK